MYNVYTSRTYRYNPQEKIIQVISGKNYKNCRDWFILKFEQNVYSSVMLNCSWLHTISNKLKVLGV